jgi:hypothetical protein
MYQDPYKQQYQPPYQPPYGAPPGQFDTNKDLEQLKMLAIGHYVLGGLTALFGLFPLIYVILGAVFIAAPPPSSRPGDPPPAALGWIFVIIGVVASLIIWGLAFGTIYAGRQLSKLQKYTFCLIMAGFNCLMFMPIGTVLGVFTFIVLLRDSVKQLFNGGSPGYPAAPPQSGNIYR